MYVSIVSHLLGSFPQLWKIPDLTKGLVFPGLLFGSIAQFIVLNIKLIEHGSALHKLSQCDGKKNYRQPLHFQFIPKGNFIMNDHYNGKSITCKHLFP